MGCSLVPDVFLALNSLGPAGQWGASYPESQSSTALPEPRGGRPWPMDGGLAALPKHGFPRPGWQGSRRRGWAPAFTFWWFQALGARGLEPSKGPFDHLLVLHLHGLGSVALVAVMARWEQLPGSAAGHLGGNMHGGLEGQAGGQTPSSEGGRRRKEGEDWRRTPEECRKEASETGEKGVHGPGRRTLCPGLASTFRRLGQ